MNQEKQIQLESIINKKYRNTAGIVMIQDNQTVYEQYFGNCDAFSRIHVYSVTKSILSILIGIAIDHEQIKHINQKVLDFFPDYTIPKRNKSIHTITLEHLLTMTAPYKYRFAPYIKYFTSDDWLQFSLSYLGGRKEPGTFRYAPLIGPDLLSGILQTATGQSVLDYATKYLFEPLDITVEKNIIFHSKEEQLAFNQSTNVSGWVADSNGLNSAAWGLTLSAMDMAKIGQLYLNHGQWNGVQIVSPNWVDLSTTEHSRWKKQNLAYGYLWWLIDESEHSFAAMGDGGNVIYVNPQKSLVVSIAATFVPKAFDRIDLIRNYMEPMI